MTNEEALVEFETWRAEVARRELLSFTSYTNRLYQPSWHHARLAAELDAVLEGRTKRLMVFMPPQNGKSELVSRKFPAYALGRNPDWQLIHCSYNSDLATEMSRDVQKVMETREYRTLFPETRLALSKDTEKRQAGAFDVVGKAGGYESAGVGGGITGKSMILGIIDDPIKSREEAESEAYRRRVWNWYIGDFSTRQMGDDARIVLVQTRWHSDDLAGRLLEVARKNPETQPWRVVSLPAILEQETPTDPRKLGEPLWPKRFSLAWLRSERALKGSYDWSALYQQSPIPPGGAMAQRAWFKILPGKPAKRKCRCWDLAATIPVHGRDPDYTVGTLLAEYYDGTFGVEHVIRVRTTSGAVDALIKQTAMADGTSVLVREWLDPGAAGKSVVASHLKMLAGWDYEAFPSSGEKSTRWRPFFVQAEAGNVTICPGAWNTDWLDEISTVPYAAGNHDDQADSVAGAFQGLTSYVDYGVQADTVQPQSRTASGPGDGAWQEHFFSR